MTTSPVMGVTEELLGVLEAEATASVGAGGSGFVERVTGFSVIDLVAEVRRLRAALAQQPASRSGMGTHMVESRDGDYVLASDYEDLSQRCRELENERDDLVGMVRAARIQRDTRAQACLDAIKERDTLRAEVEALREIREIASQCAANGGYLCSTDLIELRELLKK